MDTSIVFSFLADPSGAMGGAAAVTGAFSSLAGNVESSMAKADSAVGKSGGGWKEKLGQAGLAAGVAAGAMMAIGIAGAMQREADTARLGAQLGIPPNTAKGIGDAAGKAYAAGFGESAKSNMEAARSVIQQGLAAATDSAAVGGAIKQAQTLASTYEIDVTESTRAAGVMLKSGLAANATEAFDIMYAGLRGSGDAAGDMTDTLSEYGTKFRDLGLSGAQAMGLMQQGLRAGARDSDYVADALKEFSIRSIDGSKAVATAFGDLGMDAKKMAADIAAGGPTANAALDTTLDRLRAVEDPVKRNAIAVSLFGTKAEDLGQALYALDPSGATAALGQVKGSVDAAGKAMQETSAAKAQRFKAAMQEALIDTMAAALPTVTKIVDFLGRHEGALGKIVPVLIAFGAAMGVVALAQAAWTTVQGASAIATGISAAVQWVWNASLWACPLTWIVIAVIAVIAIIVLIAMKTDWFSQMWNAAWKWIKDAIAAVWNWVSENWPLLLAIITGPIGLAVLFITRNWDTIKAGVIGVKDWIVNAFTTVVNFITSVPGRISDAGHNMFNSIKEGFRGAINGIIGMWNRLSFRLPSINVPGFGSVGGFTLNTPDIPYLALGGSAIRAGFARVGERGPENLWLPKGAQVKPLSRDERIGRGGSGTVTVTYVGDGPAIEFLRRLIKIEGNGDVQVALGG